MKLFIDENLSPRLVAVCHELGYPTATCSRDRGLLGAPDHVVAGFCFAEDFVIVTGDIRDFVEILGHGELHPGLILLPAVPLERARQLVVEAIRYVKRAAQEDGMTAADFMVNRVVEVDEAGQAEHFDLP